MVLNIHMNMNFNLNFLKKSSKLKSELHKANVAFKKVFILYLIISQSLINTEITIFPDNYSPKDVLKDESQVEDITQDVYYYSQGYFTQKTETYHSPKYGLFYEPVKCTTNPPGGTLTYSDTDKVSFFKEESIKNYQSTISNSNKREETRLLMNTVKGKSISFPFPVQPLYTTDFSIEYFMPIAAPSSTSVSFTLRDWNNTWKSENIFTVTVPSGSVYDFDLVITATKNSEEDEDVSMSIRLLSTPPITKTITAPGNDFVLDMVSGGDFVLSNYRVIVTDKATTRKTGTEWTPDIIRSKTGLNSCKTDKDCLWGFTCDDGICTPCHWSCLKCFQNFEHADARDYCEECNQLSVNLIPQDGICDIGYVDVSQFEDFNVTVTPDGKDYNDRQTLGFWIFFADTYYFKPTTNQDLFHVVLYDRFVITIRPLVISKEIRNLNVTCHMYEDLFRLKTTDVEKFSEYEGDTNYYLYLQIPSDEQFERMGEVGLNNTDGHWVHISCAESFDHGLYYIKTTINGKSDYKEDHLKHEPLVLKKEDDGSTTVLLESDKYYKHIINDGDYLSIGIKGFHFSRTKIYLRYLQLFKEYMPKEMQYMYFTYENIKDFFELLFQIPFNYLYYGSAYRIKKINYDGTEEEFELYEKIPEKPIYKINFNPPLNFKRLPLPDANKKYTDVGILSTDVIDLVKNETEQKYLYDDKKAMCCKEYLYFDHNECTNTCIKYGMLPFTGVSLTSGYCDHFCSQSMSCDFDHQNGEYYDWRGGYCKRMGNIYNLFYRCEDDEVDYYLQYSSFYNSAQITKEFSNNMRSHIIDFWLYLDYFLPSMEKSYYPETVAAKNFFFHSNVVDGYFTFPKDYIPSDDLRPKACVDTQRNSGCFGNERFVQKEWNHFIFYTKFDKPNNSYFKYFYLNSYSSSFGWEEKFEITGVLKYITFCQKTCRDKLDQEITWTTAYYKKFRIWDGETASEKILEQYDQFYPDLINRVSSMKYYFPFTNKYISNNRIIDPKTEEYWEVTIGKYYFRKYNFASKFDLIYSRKVTGQCYYLKDEDYINCVQAARERGEGDADTLQNNFEGCDRCWCQLGYCYNCKPEHYLKGLTCRPIYRYYFKSPNLLGTNLDAKIVKITEIENKDAVTVTFWMKVIGFSADDEIRIITIGSMLDLYYASTENNQETHPYGMSLICDNRLVANVPNYREKIGDWIFFSIAYHREKSSYGTSYFPAMLKFELDRTSYAVNLDNVNKNMGMDKFTIYKELFGLIADVKFYDEYIINSLAYENRQRASNLRTPFYTPVPVKSFFPRSVTDKGCFDTSYLEGANVNDYDCVADETPSSGTTFDNCRSTCYNQCTGAWIQATNDTCSCYSINYNSQMIFRNGDKNTCRTFDFINFANCDKIVINRVPTARETKRFTLQFWIYAYNYLKGRFGGVTFYWEGHNTMIVSKGTQNKGDNLYEIKCIPYEEATHSLTAVIEINKWNYLSCAVDYVDVNYYLNINTQLNEIDLKKSNLYKTAPTDVIRDCKETNLTITDDSIYNDWGVLFLKHIRLWKWAYYNAEFLSRMQIVHRPDLFPYLLAQWDANFTKGTNAQIDNDVNYFDRFYVKELVSRNDPDKNLDFYVEYNYVYGMNVIDEYYYPRVVLCNEDGYYYDVAIEDCVPFLNLAKMNDFEFSGLPQAYSGSYSMGFWIFLEDASVLSTGLHFNWSLHLQISIIRTTRLEAYCFPQGYYSDSVPNDNIVDKFSSALNAAEVYLVDEHTSESGTWIWTICSMSHYNRKYYVNGMDENLLVENKLKSETLYQDENGIVYSYYPMRYYFSEVNLTLLHSKLKVINITNTKKIYIRSMALFRDYIPYWYSSNIRYMNLNDLEANTMYSVLFFSNFATLHNTNFRLYYFYQYNEGAALGKYTLVKDKYITLTKNETNPTWELSSNFVFLPLCEFGTKIKKKYDPKKNLCVFITDCDLTELNANYCMEERTPINCLPNYYITVDSDGQIYCSGGCIEDKLRQPGTHEINGICNTPCTEGNMVCPGTSSSQLNDYMTNYKCQDNRYRIGYYCLPKTLDSESAFFYSKCYNSPNFYHSIHSDNKFKFRTGYFYEFWMKLDHMLNNCKDGYETQVIEYYLYSQPHAIFFNTTNNIFYYRITNSPDNNVNYQISSVSEHEWNKFIIKTKLEKPFEVTIYLNFDISNPKVIIKTIKCTDMQLKNIGFCSRTNNGSCAASIVNWGSAYYKNIRVWDARTSTIELIQDFNNEIFKEHPQSLVLFYPLTIQYLDVNVITEIISGIDNIPVHHSFTKDFKSTDQNIFYNYEINFDWGKNNPNKFISAMDMSEENPGYITSTGCHKYCKRCYSTVNTNCYECNVGFILVGMECKVVNGYFLKIPAKSVGAKIPFKIEKGLQKVVDLPAWTFCIYMKFEGILVGSASQAKIMNFREDTYLAYDVPTTNLVFIVQSEEAFRDTNFNKYFGIWIPICIANYISGKILNEIYPNMLTLSVNKKDIPFTPDYKIPNTGLKIDQISLHYEVIAFFADFRIYDRFIQGNFGTMISNTAESKHLLIYYGLSGVDSCIQAEQLTTSEIVSVDCVEDYHIYLDSSRRCLDETFYFERDLSALEKPCATCNDICVTLCFNPDLVECTCDMTDGLFWLRRDVIDRTTYCEYLPFLDYSVVKDIEIKVPSSKTYESTLELWFFGYSYNEVTFNFKEIDIEWHLHNKIKVYTNANELFAQCFALWDSDNKNRWTEKIETKIFPYRWSSLRCGSEYISRYHKYFFGSEEKDLVTSDLPIDRIGKVSKLKIFNHENSYDSYGYVFLREIKLWQQYNAHYIDSSFLNIRSFGAYDYRTLQSEGIFPGLIAFIKSEFELKEYSNVKDRHSYKIYNLLGDDDDVDYLKTWTVSRRDGFIGYNIVDPGNVGNYKVLTLCEEGEVFNESSDTCTKPETTHCEYPGDIGDRCVTCPPDRIYINPVDGSCTKTCPDRYYPRDDMNECRACHWTCYTCDGPFDNNCLSCLDLLDSDPTVNLNLVPDLHKCVEICEDYHMTLSPVHPHLCVVFDADAELVNYSEDIPINVYTFERLEANVTMWTSKNYTTFWRFDPNRTREVNNDTDMVFGCETPFYDEATLTNLSTLVNGSFFEEGKKYVVVLDIISTNEDFDSKTITVPVEFILTMNCYPVNGTLTIIPETGLYNTTTFVITCNDWVDDTTDTLLYRFYYQEKGTNSVLNLRNWDYDDETMSNFTVSYYALESSTITVYCEIRDNYDAISIVSKDIVIANSLNGGVFDLDKALSVYKLPQSRTDLIYYRRSHYLMSLGIDSYKILQPITLQTKYEPSIDKTLMTKTDPQCTLDYCNNNGICDLLDEFIVCNCGTGFIGRNCHVDKNGYQRLEDGYNELYSTLIGELQSNISYYQFEVFHNLYFGASQFIQDSKFFSVNLDTFLGLAMTLYNESLLNNTAEYFDLLDYYYSYETMRMEQSRAKTKNTTGFRFRNISLENDTVTEFKTSFSYIQNELTNICKYLVNEYKELKKSFQYESKNFFLAIAPVTKDFDDINFFADRKLKYKSQVEFMKCLNYIELERLKNPDYLLYLIYIEFFIFPYGYNNTLLEKITSPLLDVKLLDTITGKFLSINGCEEEKSIKYYVPYASYSYIEDFNNQKHLYDPNEYKGPDDPIFEDPIYIEPNGRVTNITLEDRIKIYHRIYNISPQYFDDLKEDFLEQGLYYLNFTNDTNYIVYNSTHLTQFAAFFIPNNATYTSDNRFFYLKRPRIFRYFPNYKDSLGGLLFLVLLFFYILFLIILQGYDKSFLAKDCLLDFLKEQIMDYFNHYKKPEEIKEEDKVPKRLKDSYDHRDFFGRRKASNVGFGFSEQLTEPESGFFSDNKKNKNNFRNKNKYNDLKISEKIGEDFDEDIFNINIKTSAKSGVKKSNFFEGGDIPMKERLAEEELVRYKNGKKVSFDPNYLPPEYEHEDKTKGDIIRSFADITLTSGQFLRLNFKTRNIIINSFCMVSLFHPRWKKMTFLMTEVSLMLLFISIFLTLDESVVTNSISMIILYALISNALTDLMMHALAVFFYFPSKVARRLRELVRKHEYKQGELIVIAEWEKNAKTQKTKAIIGCVLCGLIILGSFYFSFGFTVVWKEQKWAFLICFVFCFLLNFLIFEFLLEAIIAIFYVGRKHNKCARAVAEFLNRMRNFRCLSP